MRQVRLSALSASTSCWRFIAAGLCAACDGERVVNDLVAQAVEVAVASYTDLADPAEVADLAASAESLACGELDRTRDQAVADGALPLTQVLMARWCAQGIVDRTRQIALAHLARIDEAQTEATLAHEAAMRAAHYHPTPTAALAAADQAAAAARARTSEQLLPTAAPSSPPPRPAGRRKSSRPPRGRSGRRRDVRGMGPRPVRRVGHRGVRRHVRPLPGAAAHPGPWTRPDGREASMNTSLGDDQLYELADLLTRECNAGMRITELEHLRRPKPLNSLTSPPHADLDWSQRPSGR